MLIASVVLLLAIQLLTQLFLTDGGVPMTSIDKSKAEDECARGFQIAELSEMRDGRNYNKTLEQFACAYLTKTQDSGDFHIFYFNNRRNDAYLFYEGMQQRFLHDLAKNPLLAYEGPVYFILSDNATIYPHTAVAMQSNCLPFMAHAYLSTAEPSKLHNRKSIMNGRPMRHHQNCSRLSFKTPFVLQPDFHFIQTRGFDAILTKIAERAKKTNLEGFEQRQAKVFWRGGSTGLPPEENRTCELLPRVQLVDRARSLAWMDVGISKYTMWCQGRSKEPNLYPPSTHANEDEWIQYRGILDIDGFVNAWGLYWRLASGSVVFKVESNYTNAYIRHLVPWIHYVPLAADFSDLTLHTQMIANETQLPLLKSIARNSQQLMTKFTYERQVDSVVHSLNAYVHPHSPRGNLRLPSK